MELIMHYQTLLVTESLHSLTITLHRPEQRNSINTLLLTELHQVLDFAERQVKYRFIILQGENKVFCTGMDFHEAGHITSNNDFSTLYMSLLIRLTKTPKVIISLLDGQVLAGGVGLVAASDLVLGTAHTQFNLPEVIWGLLPACVMPFLIRRIGFQKAYYMTLTTQTVSATQAYAMGLMDEIADDLTENLHRLILRLQRISEETIGDLKTYFKKMWIVTDEMEMIAVDELRRLTMSQRVQSNIKNFIEHQQFPWENLPNT